MEPKQLRALIAAGNGLAPEEARESNVSDHRYHGGLSFPVSQPWLRSDACRGSENDHTGYRLHSAGRVESDGITLCIFPNHVETNEHS